MKQNSNNKIQCLICKKWFKHPMSHCWQRHKILSRDYKTMFGLDVTKSLITKDIKYKMSENVKSHPEIIEKLLLNQKKTRFKKGHKINYKRSEQTLLRLSKLNLTRNVGTIKCQDCGKDFTGYSWGSFCDDCLIKRKNERQSTEYMRKYFREWTRNKMKNPEARKHYNETMIIWRNKNKEHLKNWRDEKKIKENKRCSVCDTLIGRSKNGLCIHCFNKRKLNEIKP